MTTAKRLFLRKEPGKQSLAEWWVTVVHDDRFEMVMKGAEMMLATLLTLPDNEVPFTEMPGPGLIHQMPAKETAAQKKA